MGVQCLQSKAASKGLVDAQYLLAVELISGARLQKNEEQGMYWLNIAASGQLPINAKAKLKLAWILSTHPDKIHRNGGLALKYLKEFKEQIHRTSIPKSNQTKASTKRIKPKLGTTNRNKDSHLKRQ